MLPSVCSGGSVENSIIYSVPSTMLSEPAAFSASGVGGFSMATSVSAAISVSDDVGGSTCREQHSPISVDSSWQV